VDDVTTAMIGPFPELNDFNAITASLPLPCVLKGSPPNCRYWSIQIFLAPTDDLVSTSDIICDREFTFDASGDYTLSIGGTKPAAGSVGQWLDSGSAARVKMVVIRCFLAPPGSTWRTPCVYANLTDAARSVNSWNFNDTERVAGATAISRAKTGPVSRLSTSVKLNCAALAIFPSYSASLLMGAVGGILIRRRLLNKVSIKMKGLLTGVRKLVPNVDMSMPAARASLGGSAKHSYFTALYDCTDGKEVEVEGVMKFNKGQVGYRPGEEQFRYASVTAYEFNSLPLPQYYDDTTLVSSREENGKTYFKVKLTTTPSRKGGINEMDVSASPQGVIVVRLVYPVDAGVMEECKPSIRLL